MKRSKRTKRIFKLAPWILILGVLFWLAFFYTDEYGMTSFEHTQDVFGEDDWIGWIHPLGTEVRRAVSIGPYDSVEECQNDAFDRLQNSFNEWSSAQYFCGYRCSSPDNTDREQNCKVVRK